MITRKFTKDQLRDILNREEGEVLLDEITTTSRWSTYHRFVFKASDSDKLYETEYSTAATELQCERPWEYVDEVECVEVEAFEKKVVDYRPVESAT